MPDEGWPDGPTTGGYGTDRLDCDTTRCHICGRRYPESLIRAELYREDERHRRMQRAAARLRLVTDRKLERKPSPGWVALLAAEESGTPLPAKWEAFTIRRLEEDAREHCPCRCHGEKTVAEMARALPKGGGMKRVLGVTLDGRLGRTTDVALRRLAAEEDEH